MLTHLEPRLFADTQGSRLVGSLSAVKARAPVLGGTLLYQRVAASTPRARSSYAGVWLT
jgi:hypothetical protein